jgi:hypothetical protein
MAVNFPQLEDLHHPIETAGFLKQVRQRFPVDLLDAVLQGFGAYSMVILYQGVILSPDQPQVDCQAGGRCEAELVRGAVARNPGNFILDNNNRPLERRAAAA